MCVSSQLPPRSAARSTITEPGAMPFHHLGGHQHGRLLAGDDRGGDHHVAFGDHAGQQLALAGVESFVLRGAVAARILRILGFDGEFDEAAAQALHLLFGRRTQS